MNLVKGYLYHNICAKIEPFLKLRFIHTNEHYK